MRNEIPIHYNASETEKTIYELWLEERAFDASPKPGTKKYVIMMPLPNVTGALHMGHAMDNVLQDLLIRWHRMMGDNTLWMAGTDHAGIATQAIVEKRLYELESKTRQDLGREGLIKRIWDWKDEYQKRIVTQLKKMGCSCDWGRLRFTMDRVCSRAVRWCFFSMFKDGIIYQGNRLVNWDCQLQTAVADDEIVRETFLGHFWYIRYPFIDPKPGEPEFVVVATTRPETMLGDTAVACHPDPVGALEEQIEQTCKRLEVVPQRERKALQEDFKQLRERKKELLPHLLKFVEMARDGRNILLPLQNRPIPLIADVWAKPHMGSGCVKVTPAHDQNDYEVWLRHQDQMDIINILNPDGTLNENAGPYQGMDRFEARDLVIEDLSKQGLLDSIEEHQVELGHSDRSKTPIEPYLSLQWFVRMDDVEGEVVCGRGTDKEFVAPGLAQAAIDSVEGDWRSPSARKVSFHPDPVRYSKTFLSWLREKRDWCVSRQLWWGHRIPIWKGDFQRKDVQRILREIEPHLGREDVCVRIGFRDGSSQLVEKHKTDVLDSEPVRIMVCLRDENTENDIATVLEKLGLEQDPDVLDTWFSSALWPHSTLGWPDPETVEVNPGQTPLGRQDDMPDCLTAYYPGSCLVTARDIITLWVARMIITGLYNLGDVPFTDVFIHANILDGKGERMSKSKGNGIDPVDIIEKYGADAMRYVLSELQTGTQDIRLPVKAISPFTGKTVDLARAKHGKTIFTYICPETGKEFDALGTMPEIPSAKLISERFEVGVHFCTKLWNAARLAFTNLDIYEFSPRDVQKELNEEDRWILSRLSRAIESVQRYLKAYNPSAALKAARTFFWSELCDWYLEMIKPRLLDERKAPVARQVMTTVLDQVLRLFHPFTPFITESLWQRLNEVAPKRGIASSLPASKLLAKAHWPVKHPEWKDQELENRFNLMQGVIRAVRDVRSRHGLSPKKPLKVVMRASEPNRELLHPLHEILMQMAVLKSLEVSPEAMPVADASTAVVGDVEIYVHGVVDVEREFKRLTKQRDTILRHIEQSQKKLDNESFLRKARPEVVQKERDHLEEMEAEIRNLEANLRALNATS